MFPITACRRYRAGSTQATPATLAALALVAALLAACTTRPTDHRAGIAGWADARQLVLVSVPHADAVHGRMQRYERSGGEWHPVGVSAPVVVGRSGVAWGRGLHPAQQGAAAKREGDGRAPAGVFRIGQAFGYAATHPTALPYQAMEAHDWCIDVPESPLYNKIVDAREVGAEAIAGSTEPMRRDLHKGGDERYRLGFVIEHNADARPQGGSCIFAHEWASPETPTAGCTAMAPADMEALLAWLDPRAAPMFVLLTAADHARLHARWDLPAPAND